jgi:hypothetical protein
VLSLTARHPARAGRTPGTGWAARPENSGLISRGLISAAPLHFLSNLLDNVDARGFL